MKQTFTFLAIILFLMNGHGQTVETILQNYGKQLVNSEILSKSITYTLFEDYNSNKVLEKLTGISAKDKNGYYTKIGPTEFVFSSKYSLKISNNEKILVISDPSFDKNYLNLNIASSILETFDAKEVKDKGSFWECHLTSKKNISQPYSACVLHISKTKYQLLKQILYFASALKHDYKDKNPYSKNQRLEIEFKDAPSKGKSLKEKFLLDTYVSFVDTEYKPKPIINNYTVINALTKQLR